jgi:hypothetical protein
MQSKIIDTLYDHFNAHINKHKMNILIMMENPIAIPEHTDFLDSIEKELEAIAEYMDKIEALELVEKEV